MKTMLPRVVVSVVFASSSGCGASAKPRTTEQSPTQSETQPATLPELLEPPVVPAAPANANAKAQADDPAVDSLLDQLERSVPDLNSFTAALTYDKQDELLGRNERRAGQLVYRLDPRTKRKSFALVFDTVMIGDRRRREDKRYVFDGRWLVEISTADKQFIKREIVAPGKELDPLKLGEGPFPLPIGQPKKEVLSRFDASAATLPANGLLKDLQNVQGLLLVPKPGTAEAEEFTTVELFYDKATLLPVGIIAVEKAGDRKIIRLSDIKRNPALDEAALAQLNIEEPDPREWRIDVRPWTGRE
jgi:hypothetical protein